VKFSAERVFGHFAWMVKQPEYQNSLFVFSDDVENHTTDALPMGRDSTGLKGNGDASLRPLNRYGWTSHRSNPGIAPVAPLSAGIPTQRDRRGFDGLTDEVRGHIDRALTEIAQLLLIHQYDRVIFSAELFGKGGKALTNALGVHQSVASYVQQRLPRIADPLGMYPAPSAQAAGGASQLLSAAGASARAAKSHGAAPQSQDIRAE
jgi:hypothetical protein